MSTKLKQLNQLLEAIAQAIDISDNHYEQAVKRYKSIGKWMLREESVVARYDPEIYPQGSIVLGTVIKPISHADEYDMDLVSELQLRKNLISQKNLKNLIGFEIKGYALAQNMNCPAKEGKRCWTLNYSDDAQFHIDILPAIPDSESYRRLLESRGHQLSSWSDSAIAITDNTLRNYNTIDNDWPRSNPRGYVDWFRSRMETEFNARRQILAESNRTSVEDVPEYKVKTPLQQAIQILKRHRDIMFAEASENKPISIIITTLAGQAYNNERNLMETLQRLLKSMPSYIQSNHGLTFIPNPVDPLENFADKWQEYPQRKLNFYKWLQRVQQDLDSVLKLSDIKGLTESLKLRLGERAVDEARRNYTKSQGRHVLPLAVSTGRTPSLFDVPHRQMPEWPMTLSRWVEITGRASRKRFRSFNMKSNSQPLRKHWSLQFVAETNVPKPYDVYWQVVNTGDEARRANGLRGGFDEGVLENGRQLKNETTLYSGTHSIECFVIKNGQCWARSGEFVVNIQ